MHRTVITWAAVAALSGGALVACSSSSGSGPAASTAAHRPPSSAAAPLSTAAPQSAPAPELPAGLAGVWHKRVEGSDQKMALAPGQFRFYVDPANAATGTLAVSGDKLTFANSNTCSAAGTYRFVLTGDSLRFAPVGTDPCPRSTFMAGRAWKRSG
jgi:hypothetical protein